MKVLHLMRSLKAGGIGTFILNNYRIMDGRKIQFDFAITHGGMGEYGKEIEERGGHIYFISTDGNRSLFDGIKQVYRFYKLCKKNNYNVVHCHYYFANAFFLLAAKLAGIKVRVSHCHNTRTKSVGITRRIFEFFSRKLLLKVGTVFLGCADESTKFLYGEDAFNKGIAKTLYNGIDYEYWDLKKLDVDEVKAKYSVKSEKVLLFVGRMEEQKNPIYALQITNEIHKRIPDILLFMVGDGSLLESARKYANDNRMNEYIKFLPANSDIRELQSISDIMIAPSLWEGLGIAYIEAQKMKTMVFSSDQVPYEVDMGYCKHYPLGEPNTWINGICDYLSEKSRDITLENPLRFDIKETSNKLLSYYNS